MSVVHMAADAMAVVTTSLNELVFMAINQVMKKQKKQRKNQSFFPSSHTE